MKTFQKWVESNQNDPFQRGIDDYKAGIFKCPYSPTSKKAKRWHEGQSHAAMQSAMDDGYYDGGYV